MLAAPKALFLLIMTSISHDKSAVMTTDIAEIWKHGDITVTQREQGTEAKDDQAVKWL